eukprot:1389712-Amphidinium_carterae.2
MKLAVFTLCSPAFPQPLSPSFPFGCYPMHLRRVFPLPAAPQLPTDPANSSSAVMDTLMRALYNTERGTAFSPLVYAHTQGSFPSGQTSPAQPVFGCTPLVTGP